MLRTGGGEDGGSMVDLYPIVAGEMLETRTGQGTATSEWYGVGGLAALSPRRGRPGRPQGCVTPASANAMTPKGQIGHQKKQDRNDSIVACRGASPTTALPFPPGFPKSVFLALVPCTRRFSGIAWLGALWCPKKQVEPLQKAALASEVNAIGVAQVPCRAPLGNSPARRLQDTVPAR